MWFDVSEITCRIQSTVQEKKLDGSNRMIISLIEVDIIPRQQVSRKAKECECTNMKA